MPEHFKALIVILGLAVITFRLVRNPLQEVGYQEATLKKHWMLWVLITLIAFFAHSFWIYVAATAFLLMLTGPGDRNPLALYLAIMFAAPHFTMQMGGFGPIQNLFSVNFVRILGLVILLPIAIKLRKRKRLESPAYRAADLALAGYLLVQLVSTAVNESVTVTIRTGFYLFVDIVLPFYVASRAVDSLAKFREIAAALLFATTILASIAIFETGKGWLLYESLRAPLSVPIDFFVYLTRSEGGPLRAVVSTTYPIILGYVFVISVAMFNYAGRMIKSTLQRRMIAVLLAGGLIAAFSRGPWVGALMSLLILTVLGPGKSKRISMILGVGGTAVLVLLATPFGNAIIQFLPFVGSVETANIDYRALLFTVSMEVCAQNPVFGDYYFMQNPLMEQVRQGQGVVDITNTYLQVLLPHGLVGLTVFLAALLLPVRAVWRSRKKILAEDTEAELLSRSLIAAMAGILITLATASNIGAISTLYWITAGLCLGFARSVESSAARQPNNIRQQRAIYQEISAR